MLVMATFMSLSKNDDLLFMKRNGQIRASLKYIGNNTFEGALGSPKVSFELQKDGTVKVVIVRTATVPLNGIKYLKYN